eukprot:TRINITY_DN11905_c0_g3_i1.p1 TRINITY_DN11905_c0_g3~~TRINITY_DN11905_c0_g3_i1.p1  ORF type:complete len:879 (+),score=202.01 TRINITY_DN11905_c0_g3_i1:55-2691(+)
MAGAGAPCGGRHLVVLVSGACSGGGGLADALRERGGKGVLVLHMGGCGSALYCGGLGAAGDRAAGDIAEACRMAAAAGGPRVRALSLVGLGVGGLVCRGAVARLYSSWPALLLRELRLVSFVTVATPHLGWLPAGSVAGTVARFAALTLSPLLGVGARQLLLRDDGKALLGLSAPQSACSAALALFGRRVCYAAPEAAATDGGCAASCLMLPCSPPSGRLPRCPEAAHVADPAAAAAAVTAAWRPQRLSPHPAMVGYDNRPAVPFLLLAQPPRSGSTEGGAGAELRLRTESGAAALDAWAAAHPQHPQRPPSPPPVGSTAALARAQGPPESGTCVLRERGTGARRGAVSDCCVADCSGCFVERARGDVRGQDFVCDALHDCEVRVLDRVQTLSVHRCTDTRIVAGPAAGSVRVSECTNCQIFCAAPLVTVRGCVSVVLHVHCLQPPVVESCSRLTLRPYAAAIPCAARLWEEAGLPCGRPNRFADAVDLSAEDSSVPQPHVVIDASAARPQHFPYSGPALEGAAIPTELPERGALLSPTARSRPAAGALRGLVQSAGRRREERMDAAACPFDRLPTPPPSPTGSACGGAEGAAGAEWAAAPAGADSVVPASVLSPLRYRATRPCCPGQQSELWVSDAVGQRAVRPFGSLRGAVFGVQRVQACLVLAADWTASALVDGVSDSCVVIAPCSGAVVLADCCASRIFACCARLRLRNCHGVAVHAWTPERPYCDGCSGVTFAPWPIALPRLGELFALAGLDPGAPSLWHSPRGDGWQLTERIPTRPTPLELPGEPAAEMPPPMLAALAVATYFADDAAGCGRLLRRRLNEALVAAEQLGWERVLLLGRGAHHAAALSLRGCGLYGDLLDHVAAAVFSAPASD